MTTLAADLKRVFITHLQNSSPAEVLSILGELAAEPEQRDFAPISHRFIKLDAKGHPLGDNATDCVAVSDATTGLVWSRDNVPGGRMDWAAAKKATAALDLCGHKDWRLPTVKELLSLVDYERHNPAIDTAYFNCEPNYYWTSTPAASSPGDYAWLVYFNDGGSGWADQSDGLFVRAVRVGQ